MHSEWILTSVYFASQDKYHSSYLTFEKQGQIKWWINKSKDRIIEGKYIMESDACVNLKGAEKKRWIGNGGKKSVP